MPNAIDTIRRQIHAAKSELDAYTPVSMGWHSRCLQTAEAVIPWLCGISVEICEFCESVYNSPQELRASWALARKRFDLGDLSHKIDVALDREAVLLSEIAGDVVSRVLSNYLIEKFPGGTLCCNGKSDYPDLYLNSHDYSNLPEFVRGSQYGASRKGAEQRPVRVPDGIEIKTCRRAFRVDCHHNHIGLHIGLLYKESNGKAQMVNLMAAFLRECDYHISNINTGATTRKASFGAERFVSLLPQ